MRTIPGDRHEQFLRLFTIHQLSIRAFIRTLAPSRADTDDIFQEVAVVLWQRFEEFRVDGNFYSWSCGVARFKVLAWLRDQGRDRLVLDSDVIEQIAAVSLKNEPQWERRRDALHDCLQQLAAADRDLLVRAYQPQVAIQDVASSSGRSLPAFYQWLYRTRLALQGCVRRKLGLGESR